MRLTAQRVASPEGKEGINAFCYLHGPQTWLDEPPAEVINNPGHLAHSHVEVLPPGNRVRSYLDVLAPDHVPSDKIARDVIDAVALLLNRSLPLQIHSGDTTFTFNAELRLAAGWQGELKTLLWHALAVRA
jgi:hypothetical protein